MTEASIEPSASQLRAFEALAGRDGPITMLNLLRYRRQADYGRRSAEHPCSGREAYRRYAEHALPCIEAVGGHVVFLGAAHPSVIGPPSEQWHDVLLVEYPSVRAMLDMLASERYQAIVHHRSAALADSRLVPVTAGAPAFGGV